MLRTAFGVSALLMLAGFIGTASAAQIRGTVYNLPPAFSPITDQTVDIQVFAPVAQPDGRVQRGPDGRLTSGSLLQSGSSDAKGQYSLPPIPAIPGQPQQIVNIVFNRRGFGITQELNGVVVEDGRINVFDAVVPLPLPAVPPMQYYYYPAIDHRHCVKTRSSGWFRH